MQKRKEYEMWLKNLSNKEKQNRKQLNHYWKGKQYIKTNYCSLMNSDSINKWQRVMLLTKFSNIKMHRLNLDKKLREKT